MWMKVLYPRCPTTAPVSKQLLLAALSWTHSHVRHSILLRYGFVHRMNKTSINPSVMTDNFMKVGHVNMRIYVDT